MKRLVLPLLSALCLSALAVPAHARVGVSITVGEPGRWERIDDRAVIIERNRWEPAPVHGWRPEPRVVYREPHHGRWSRWEDDERAWRHARWHQWRERERCREEARRSSARIYFRSDD